MTNTTDAPRQRRRRFTDSSLENWTEFRPGPKRKLVPHPEKIGHYIIVQKAKETGAAVRSFAVQARDGITGKQVWHTVGRCDRMSVADAAREGDKAIARIRQGLPPVEPPAPPPETLRALAAEWLRRYVIEKGLRTRPEIERKLVKYILPRIGDRVFLELKRSDIVKLLDTVAEEHGQRMADAVYTVLLSIAYWHAGRSDYVVAYDGIPKHSEAPPRDRVLSHVELREIWRLASAPEAGPFGAIVKVALLTGQRREKIIAMRHRDVVDGLSVSEVQDSIVDGKIVKTVHEEVYDGVWCIPSAPREKGNGGDLVLPQAARDVIAAQPRFASNDYVFPARRRGFINNMHLRKAAFDANLPKGFAPWRVHDLRRTARTLLSEAGVDRDIAERVLGHRVGGRIEGIYNRFPFIKEKREALAALAQHIRIIVAGPVEGATLVPPTELEARRAGRGKG
jgi:integrase